MIDYERASEALRAQLWLTSRYREFAVLEMMLRENLSEEGLYGSTRETKSERFRIIDQLNGLAIEALGIGFTDLSLGRTSPAMQVSAHDLVLMKELHATPSPGNIPPPVQPRLQHLPFDELTWEQFEALCATLIEASPLTMDCSLYGVQGNKQQGVDIIASQRGTGGRVETWVYQCKRYRRFAPSQLRQTLQDIRFQADYYVIILSVRATAAMRDVTMRRPDTFLWDASDIARKLKNYPVIVEDFFGPVWREAFCG